MAARIYGPGEHILDGTDEVNGIEVGQWISRGTPIYSATIIHTENIVTSGSNRVAALNDADFAAGAPGTGGTINFIEDGNAGGSLQVGDDVELIGSTSGDNVLIGEITDIVHQYFNLISLGGFNVGGGNNAGRYAFEVRGSYPGIRVGQTVRIAAVTSTIREIVRGIGTHNDTQIVLEATDNIGTQRGAHVQFLREFELEVEDPGGVTITGDVSMYDLSTVSLSETYEFSKHGPQNGRLFLPGGAEHILEVPEGLQISANTLN